MDALSTETVPPPSAEPGQPERFDYEYTRNGTANRFRVSEPLPGGRSAKAFAEGVRGWVEEVHPDAAKVVRVLDNLNTPQAAALSEAFPPEQARRIIDRLEIPHPPKQGSWRNRAEIERSMLSGPCRDRRIDNAAE